MADRTLGNGRFAWGAPGGKRMRAAAGIALACAAALGFPYAGLAPAGPVAALMAQTGALPQASGLERLGSIVVKAHHEVDGKQVPLAGDTYSLAMVATGSVKESKATFSTVKAFEAYDCDWGSLDAAELRSKAKKLDAFARKGGLFTAGKVVTGGDGTASFGGVRCGVYLLSRTASAPENERVLIDPVLVLVPYEVNGELFFGVEVTPKSEDPNKPIDPGDPDDPDKPTDPDDPDKPGDPDDPDGPDGPGDPEDPGEPEKPDNPLDDWLEENGLPQTGDIQFQVAAAFLVAGVAMLVASRLIKRRGRDGSVDANEPSGVEGHKKGKDAGDPNESRDQSGNGDLDGDGDSADADDPTESGHFSEDADPKELDVVEEGDQAGEPEVERMEAPEGDQTE